VEQKKRKKNLHESIIRYSGLSVKMTIAIYGGVFAGRKIDDALQLENPIFTLLLSLLGIALAILIIIKDTIGFSSKK
jgi:F0F1-type ATP synthase assembly protein I